VIGTVVDAVPRDPCCDGTDAERVDDADWETKDGQYRVRINGEWVDVPTKLSWLDRT
jgi:hypothetical protein